MKMLRNLGAALAVAGMASAAHAEDLLGNSATSAFANLSDTQTSLAPLILGVVGFSVVLGLAIKWTRKAG